MSAHAWKRRSRFLVCLGATAALLTGCSATPTPPDDGNGDPQGEETVLVVFRNLSGSQAVQVNFHATGEPLAVIPDDLFVPGNLYTTGVGVAGTGIVQPSQFDFVRDFPCSPSLILGTSGGDFLDNDTGEVLGASPPRWIEASAVGFCGGAVTFTFSSEDGEFFTSISIDH